MKTFVNSQGKKVPLLLKYYYTQKDKKRVFNYPFYFILRNITYNPLIKN